MPQLKIDPIQTYYSVARSLIGRILLFYLAGWCGGLLGRIAVGFEKWGDLIRPADVIENIIGRYGIGELIIMVAWPMTAAGSAAEFSVLIFFLAAPVIVITFVIFIYSEEPPPAWCLGVAGFVSILHVLGSADTAFVSWAVLFFILTGIGSAFWWALRVFHPELIQTVGDLFRGRSRYCSVSAMSPRHKAPPGTWPDPVEGWNNRPIQTPKDGE